MKAKLVPALGWDVSKQGGFPVSLVSDAAGNIWVGTEGNGVWKYDAGTKAWTQFTIKDGLGDDCAYALAFDQQGRLWAGHLNHGVSVYNGVKWQNYGLIDGPLGDRVFAIAVSPRDGDVWIATDMGLARYSEARQDWDYYTRASGLPADQIQAIAFGADGQLYAGTQCNGIASAGPGDNYTKWQSVTASDPVPAAQDGEGLASNLINSMTSMQPTMGPAGGGSVIFAGTPAGVAASARGAWHFMHGKDWQDHTAGPYLAGHNNGAIPAEDWITAVQPDGMHLWLGYRKSGVESIDLNGAGTMETQANVEAPASVLIRAILPLPGDAPLFAAYDGTSGGVMTLDSAQPYTPPSGAAAANAATANLPAPVPAPALDDAKVLAARLGKMTQHIAPGEAYYLADDWRTEGDWIGRYGSGYAKLCGIGQNGDQEYPLQPGYEVNIEDGPHHEAADAGPVWYHTNETTDDLRDLYDPTIGHRRDAEDNDVSYDTKTYPESYDGPGLWVRVTVPDGVNCLSLYFLNDDAHTKGGNKYRDYDVEVLPGDLDDSKIATATPLARTRVTDFWGGVYKQFFVCGPARYVVRIGRNRSCVTTLHGIFMDPVNQPDTQPQLPGFDAAPYTPPDPPANFQPTPLAAAAIDLWGDLDASLSIRGAVPLQMPLRIWCYRAAIAGQAPPEIIERWRWQISIWTPDDRKKFDQAVKAARDAPQ